MTRPSRARSKVRSLLADDLQVAALEHPDRERTATDDVADCVRPQPDSAAMGTAERAELDELSERARGRESVQCIAVHRLEGQGVRDAVRDVRQRRRSEVASDL